MTHVLRRRLGPVLGPLCLVLAMAGCTTLPSSGDVHTRAEQEDTHSEASYFIPPGPVSGDDQEGIVRGFLLAMQANPPGTAVARTFLSARAKTTWDPNLGTIVYDGATVEAKDGQVVAQLGAAHRLTAHGSWVGRNDAHTETVPFTLVREDGEWRIDDPPDALAVPASYFSSLFVPFYLYFFDQSGTVLVPSRVFVPRGEETATNLVRGLLAGPPPRQRAQVVTALLPGLDLDPVVVVNDAGIAEVPLGEALLALKPAELNRVVVQLAWTLRQIPGITRLRVTVDGAPVPLTDGRTDISVGTGQEYDPAASARTGLLAISGGRVVKSEGDSTTAVGGPFGQPGFALRSLAWGAHDHVIAAVSGNGRRLFVAPDNGARSSSRVRTVLDGAADLLRPTYDRFGDLWAIDATDDGAVVHVVRGGRDRELDVRGITGRQVSSFTVTRDGTELVAVLANGGNPTVQVSGLVRSERGRVRRALPARTLRVTGADLGPALDVAQYSVSSVAVLTRPTPGSSQIVVVELDGSPEVDTAPGRTVPETVPDDELSSLIASPDPVVPLRVVGSEHRLYTFTDDGRWSRTALTDVVAATYAE